MTDNDKSTIVHMMKESQDRTFVINDKTCEIKSCVRACNLRTAFMVDVMHVSVILLFNVHINVSKFDTVTNRITKRAKREREPSRVPVKIL